MRALKNKILSTMATALALLLVTLGPGSIAQGVQDFVLINATGVDIFYVHISPSGVNDWQEDVLGEDVLPDGGQVEIGFHRNEAAQYWDLRVMDEEENPIVWENLNLTRIYSVTLYYDAESGHAWAETESI